MRKLILFLCLLVVGAIAYFKPDVFKFEFLRPSAATPDDYLEVKVRIQDAGGEVSADYPYHLHMTGEIINTGKQEYTRVVLGIEYVLHKGFKPDVMPMTMVEVGGIKPRGKITVNKVLGKLPRNSIDFDRGGVYVKIAEGPNGFYWEHPSR